MGRKFTLWKKAKSAQAQRQSDLPRQSIDFLGNSARLRALIVRRAGSGARASA
jgi:hypothetical protein